MYDHKTKVSASGLTVHKAETGDLFYPWTGDIDSYRKGFDDGQRFVSAQYKKLVEKIVLEKIQETSDIRQELMLFKLELSNSRQEANGKFGLEEMYVRLLDDLRNHFKEFLDAPDEVLKESGLEDLAPYLRAKDVYFEALYCEGRDRKKDGLFTPLGESPFDEDIPF